MLATGVHKEYMIGEHARCLYKMSQALAQEPGGEVEARQFLDDAVEMYSARVRDGNTNPTEEDYDKLVYCIWR